MKYFIFGISAILLLLFLCCKEAPQEDDSNDRDLFGIWQTHNREVEASLHIFKDSTFHVDVHKDAGIEVSGIATLLSGQYVIFKNTQGTDPASSNPYPGKYSYTIVGNTAHFKVIDDTLSRRSGLLAGPWTRNKEQIP
jgi:hypothetical protein